MSEIDETSRIITVQEALARLQQLVGSRWCYALHAGNMRGFHFGLERGGRPPGEYVIHVQCPWRIETEDHILTGSADWYRPVRPDDYGLDSWNPAHGGSLQELKLRELLQDNRHDKGYLANCGPDLVVAKAQISDHFGGCVIGLSRGYRILIFPAGSHGEYWRMFQPMRAEPSLVFEAGEIHLDFPEEA